MIYRRAQPTDAAALAEFAARVFVSSFDRQLPHDQLAGVASQRFTRETQQGDIADPNSTVFLAVDPEIVGYAHLVIDNRPEFALPGGAPVELKRIYVDAAWHGRGVAQELLGLVESHALQNRCDVLWLLVWDGNARGIAFYEKHGFSSVGAKQVEVGSWVLGHNCMAKRLRDLPGS